MPITPTTALALRLGEIFKSPDTTLDELRYPKLARQARSLLTSNPSSYGRILEDLLDGISPTQISDASGHPLPLIRFISRLHPEIQASQRNQLTANLQSAALELSSRILDEIPNIKPDNLPRTLSLVTEQLALLQGHATARVEHLNAPSRDKLLDMFNQLSEKKVIEVTERNGNH